MRKTIRNTLQSFSCNVPTCVQHPWRAGGWSLSCPTPSNQTPSTVDFTPKFVPSVHLSPFLLYLLMSMLLWLTLELTSWFQNLWLIIFPCHCLKPFKGFLYMFSGRSKNSIYGLQNPHAWLSSLSGFSDVIHRRGACSLSSGHTHFFRLFPWLCSYWPWGRHCSICLTCFSLPSLLG